MLNFYLNLDKNSFIVLNTYLTIIKYVFLNY
jgi:hypothetical protein